MRIGEAAHATGLTPRALRHYEQQGLLRPGRTSSGHRVYTSAHLEQLRAIGELLRAGLTVADVRSFAHLLDRAADDGAADGEPGHCAVAEVSLQRLRELDRRIEQLSLVRTRLAAQLTDRFGDLFAERPATGSTSSRASR
ncbi:MerR family transcriptional regulator [Streptomyces sp. NPDC127068]|uniref:MerR family transcriptional regulator n=1 Tax=Streptomyces sp. NPDC127068 TaxID=3347127 RepID=UPI003660D383